MHLFDPPAGIASGDLSNPDDAPVLVVVVNNALDMQRVCEEGWYRIPLARLPRRVAAEYLAFYQTGAFPPEERWCIRRLAPVQAYRLATRRALIPDEPDHPRAGDLYYKVALGPVQELPNAIPSRKLRRITFIATTLARVKTAEEINDLWIKSTPQERLWQAIKQAGIEAECQYPPGTADDEDEDGWLADFAVLDDRGGGVALVVTDEAGRDDQVGEPRPLVYASAGWRLLFATGVDLARQPELWAGRLAEPPPV